MTTGPGRGRRRRDRRAWRDPGAPLPPNTERCSFAGREFLLSRPPAQRSGPYGLILNLHGLTSNLLQQLEYSRLASLGPPRGYVVVTPQGSGRIPHWMVPPLPGPDDAGFLRGVLKSVAASVPVDPGRRFATGISNGAAMAMALAATWPGYFAAVAPVAGVNAVPPRPVAGIAVCAFHGTEDRIVPFVGGTLFGGLRGGGSVRRALGGRATPRVQLASVEAVMRAFAAANGVHRDPVVVPIGTDVVQTTYAAAPGLELFTVTGGGHTWPGSADTVRLLGATTRTIDATAVMLDRFDALAQS